MDDKNNVVTPLPMPDKATWERVEVVQALLREVIITTDGKGDPAVQRMMAVEALTLWASKEHSWTDDQTAMVLALLASDATPDSVSHTVIPF